MTIIKSWPKSDTQDIRVALDTYKGKPIISIRTWYEDPKSGEKCAGKNGINLPIEHLRPLAKAVRLALKEAEKEGLIEKEGEE